MALISNQQTILGFEIAGFSESTLVHKFPENTEKEKILEAFNLLLKKDDVGIIFISSNFAESIKKEIDEYKGIIPSVFIIPLRK